MGSRSRRNAALAALVLGGCAVGAPTGFSSGDQWTVPLVGPLENGVLLVPVYIGKENAGPYLFAIDPDATVSAVDDKIVSEAHLRSGQGPRLDDELDHQNPHFYAEILQMRVGTLYVQNKSALIVKSDTYDVDGRQVDGVLGRDVIADSLVWGFDRDQGIATLMTQPTWKKQAAMAGDVPIHYELLSDRNRAELAGRGHGAGAGGQDLDVIPVSRRIASAMIDGQKFVMHLDFGAKASQLRARSWDAAKLEASPAQGLLVDETGTGHNIDKLGKAAEVTLGPLSVPNVVFVPYVEARWRQEDLEGALGLDFWKPYTIWADWDAQNIHVVPRHEADLTARAGRWQMKSFSGCATPSCMTSSIVDPLAKIPEDQRPATHPGVVVSFQRDKAAANTPLEVLVSVKSADGAEKQRIVVNFPASSDRAMTHLPGELANATLTVLDIDPFPRPCQGDGGCVDVIASDQPAHAQGPAPAPAAPEAPVAPAAPAQ
jgi:Aspartyl protease